MITIRRGAVVLLASALIFAGCESTGSKTTTGAVTGGLIGATAGGIIGHQTGHPFAGAGIGAAVGTLSGGLIGNQLDKVDRRGRESNPSYIPITSIADMGDKGAPDDVIISEIQRTNSTYYLTSEIITYLRQHKVGDKVINYMLATGNK